MKNNVLKEKSFVLACDVIDITDLLISKNKKPIADQLLRCGSSIGANIRESFYSESRKDLIHKLSISLKNQKNASFGLN